MPYQPGLRVGHEGHVCHVMRYKNLEIVLKFETDCMVTWAT